MDSQLVTTTTPLTRLDFKRIRRNHQRGVGRAREHGVSITEGETLEELKIFRRLYLIEGRSQGAPQAGWNFFENLHRFARSRYRLLLAWRRKSVLAVCSRWMTGGRCLRVAALMGLRRRWICASAPRCDGARCPMRRKGDVVFSITASPGEATPG